MKKQVVGALFALSFLFALTFVSAATVAESIGSFFSVVSDIILAIAKGLAPLAKLLFGSENIDVNAATNIFTIANIFIFIIVFVIVYLIVDSMEFFQGHTFFSWLLSIAVSVLAVRFLSDGMITAIIFPYKALGIALAAGLPFVLYFIAVETKISSSFGRKAAWIFLGVIYVFMYVARISYTDTPGAPSPSDFSSDLTTYAWIYVVAALVCLAMALMDGTFASMRSKWALRKVGKESNEDAVISYKQKLAALPGLVKDEIYTKEYAAKKKKEYLSKIAYFEEAAGD